MSTVKSALNLSSCIANIIQILRHPGMASKILIIVEGVDDKRFYSSVFQPEAIDFHILGGCLKCVDVLQNCNAQYESKYIVLKDADFDHLNRTAYTFPNIFLTDTHDAEIMMLNDESMNSICSEYLIKSDDLLLDKIFSDLRELSYIKWYNDINNYHINFKILNISKIYDGSKSIDIQDCLDVLYSNSANSGKTKIKKEDIENFINTKGEIDLKLLSNGHDVCECIFIRLDTLTNGKACKRDIPKFLRIKYSSDDFKKTNMYSAISDWSSRYKYSLLK